MENVGVHSRSHGGASHSRSPPPPSPSPPPVRGHLDHRRLGFVAVCTRGQGVSVYDYGDYSETLLGLRDTVIICTPGPEGSRDPIYQQQLRKMGHRFGNINLYMLEKWPPTSQELDEIVLRHNITDLVLEKSGERDGVLTTVRGVRNLVHANVAGSHPHGDVYARVSSSISGTAPVVPLVVRPPPPDSAIGPDLRGPNGIPGKCKWPKDGCPTIAANATVFCRHGGQGQFNIPWAREAVLEVAGNRSDIVFLFLTTQPICWWEGCPRNIIHLPDRGVNFERYYRTCDAMLHARKEGETFGLAPAEFSVRNKPVITCNNTWYFYKTAMAHVAALGDKGIYYQSKAALLDQLLAFNRTEAARRDWRAYSGFDPPTVMARFEAVFLRGGDG